MQPLILIVMDGWGVSDKKEGNAILLAKTPNFDYLKNNYPYVEILTHGTHVGLAEGMMGGSEVGHLNMGAGRIVKQNVVKINEAIQNGSFFENENILKVIENVKKKKSSLHLMGLLSDAGVHSYSSHLYSFLELAQKKGVNNVFIHIFSDGRDSGPKDLKKYIKELKEKIKECNVGKIATIMGRFYAMDRDNRWDRTEKAYLALAEGKGKQFNSVLEGIENAYQKGETDEFIEPLIINGFKGVQDSDSVISFNYRADRMRQITKSFLKKDFNYFSRDKKDLVFVAMTRYYPNIPAFVVFEKEKLKNVLGKILSDKNMSQLRIAETEKRAHVTYFFNGLREKPFDQEDRFFVPSPQVKTYDLKPEMSAFKVTEELVEIIKKDKYDFILLNLVNVDMVGHTGNLKAGIKAVEIVDQCLGKIVREIKNKKGVALITADHGNAEEMTNNQGEIKTEHSLNPVPFILVSEKCYNLNQGNLSNVAPTILELLNIKKPEEMTSKSLIKK